MQINVLEPTIMALFEPKAGEMTREEAIERFDFVDIYKYHMALAS